MPPPAVFPGPLAAYHTDVEQHLHHAAESRGERKKEEEGEEEEGEEEEGEEEEGEEEEGEEEEENGS